MAGNETNEPVIHEETTETSIANNGSTKSTNYYAYGDADVDSQTIDYTDNPNDDVIKMGSKDVTTFNNEDGTQTTRTREYYPNGNLKQATYESEGSKIVVDYNSEGKQVSGVETKTEGNVTTTVTYDANNNVTGTTIVETNGNSQTTTQIAPDGSKTETTIRGGAQGAIVTTNEYNSNGEVTKTTVTNSNANGNTTTVTDNTTGKTTTTTTNPNGEVTERTTTTNHGIEGSTTVHEKFENGKPVESKTEIQNHDGSKAVVETTKYNYKEDGTSTKTTTRFDQDPNSNNQKTTTTVNYDENGTYDGETVTQYGKDGSMNSTEYDRTGQNYTTTNTTSSGETSTTTGNNNAYFTTETTTDANGNVTNTVKDAEGNVLYTTDANGNVTSSNPDAIAAAGLEGQLDENGTLDIDKFDLNEDNLMTAIGDLDRFMNYCSENAGNVGAVDTSAYDATTQTPHHSGSPHSPGFSDAASDLRNAAQCLSGVCGTNGAKSGFAPMLGRLCNTVSLLRESNGQARQSMDEILNEARQAGQNSGDTGPLADDAGQQTGGGGGGGAPGGGFGPGSGGVKPNTPQSNQLATEADPVKPPVTTPNQPQQQPTPESSQHDSGEAQHAYQDHGGGGGGGKSTKDSQAATNEEATTAIDDMLNNNAPVVEIIETGNQVHDIGEMTTLGADIGSLNIEALTNHISAKNIGAAAGVGLAAAGAAAAIAAYKDKQEEEEDEEAGADDYSMDPNLNYDDLMM